MQFSLLLTKTITMKKLIRLSLIAILSLSAIITSCTKYEEGSKFTFLTAKMRMVGDWTVTNITYDNNNVTSSYPDISISIKDDQSYSLKWDYGSFSLTETGTWAFNADKTTFITTNSNGAITERIILMLKNKMVKLKEVNSSGISTIWTLEQ